VGNTQVLMARGQLLLYPKAACILSLVTQDEAFSLFTFIDF
jgi:hypothetical protein